MIRNNSIPKKYCCVMLGKFFFGIEEIKNYLHFHLNTAKNKSEVTPFGANVLSNG